MSVIRSLIKEVDMAGYSYRREKNAKQDETTQYARPSAFECLGLHRAKLSPNSFDVKSERMLP